MSTNDVVSPARITERIDLAIREVLQSEPLPTPEQHMAMQMAGFRAAAKHSVDVSEPDDGTVRISVTSPLPEQLVQEIVEDIQDAMQAARAGA